MKTLALNWNLSCNKKGLMVFFLFYNMISYAQSLNIKAGCDLTSDQLLSSLFDSSAFTLSNLSESGSDYARGSFNNNNTNEPLNNGIVITTGNAIDAEAPNNNTYGANTSFSLFSTPDNDLLTLVSPSSTFKDLYKLEFDIVPQFDTLIFTYSFASEEYLTYSPPNDNSGRYNDVFGIFISGPNIIGYPNVANIPGTNENVSVFTINPKFNSTYFIDNTSNTPASIQYNGFTKIIQTKIPVIRGQMYHVKVAIADLRDSYIDSGVFIKASGSSLISQVLPIEMIKWYVENKGLKNVLNWEIASEDHTGFYLIERSSDGSVFQAISTIQPNSMHTRVYSYEDLKPIIGANYYRLKQIDLDGSYIYSVILLAIVPLSDIDTYPNPANGNFTIQIEAAAYEKGTIEIIDLGGKKIFEQPIELKEGSNYLQCNILQLPSGEYFVSVKSPHIITISKRIIYN